MSLTRTKSLLVDHALLVTTMLVPPLQPPLSRHSRSHATPHRYPTFHLQPWWNFWTINFHFPLRYQTSTNTLAAYRYTTHCPRSLQCPHQTSSPTCSGLSQSRFRVARSKSDKRLKVRPPYQVAPGRTVPRMGVGPAPSTMPEGTAPAIQSLAGNQTEADESISNGTIKLSPSRNLAYR